jgi:hypothetical protein
MTAGNRGSSSRIWTRGPFVVAHLTPWKRRSENCGPKRLEKVQHLHVRGRAVELGVEPLVVEPGVLADPALLGAGDQRADHEDGDDHADEVGAQVEARFSP